ncbi:MAG: hypothetical protein O7D30_12245, partial [Rickettsia endosymbiont of Ixodes persulcatus]|nr:hypothetical protein [Rickettsia endosymbiont of Ixodes persulcatus]
MQLFAFIFRSNRLLERQIEVSRATRGWSFGSLKTVTIKNYFDALERETCEAAEAGFALGPRFQRPSSRENKNKTICFKVVSLFVRLVDA